MGLVQVAAGCEGGFNQNRRPQPYQSGCPRQRWASSQVQPRHRPHPGLRLFSQAQRNHALEAEQSFVFVYIDRPMCLRTRAGHVESSPDRVLYSVDSVNFHQAIPSVALTPNPDFKKSFRQSSAAGSVTPAPYILHTMFVTKTSKFQPPFPWQCAPVVLC